MIDRDHLHDFVLAIEYWTLQLVNVRDPYRCLLIRARVFSRWGILGVFYSQIWQGLARMPEVQGNCVLLC